MIAFNLFIKQVSSNCSFIKCHNQIQYAGKKIDLVAKMLSSNCVIYILQALHQELKVITQKMVMNKSTQQIAWSHHLGLEHLVVDDNNSNDRVSMSSYVLGPVLSDLLYIILL